MTDEDGVEYEQLIPDDYIKKNYSFDLRCIRIHAIESTEIMGNKCTIVYLSDGEVIISTLDYNRFNAEIVPKYNACLNQLSILNFIK